MNSTKVGGMLAMACLLLLLGLPASEGKAMRIDTHAHFVPPFYYDMLAAKGLKSGGRSVPRWNVSAHLAIMDSLDIDMAVLSVSSPGATLATSDSVETSRLLARELNDYGQMLVASFPGRFLFLATLTLPDVEGSIAEAKHALDNLKAAGIVLMGNSQGEYLGNENFDPLMEVLNERKAVVFIHPNSLKVSKTSDESANSELPSFVVDFLLDTTRAAANLVRKNVTGRYPNIKFLLAHSGGFVPFAATRMAGALTIETKGDEGEMLNQLKKFYVDTALSSGPSALPSTLAFVPHDQITFGTDYPFAPSFVVKSVSAQLDAFPLVDGERHQIHFDNANNLFDDYLSHWRAVWGDRSLQQPLTQKSSSLFKAL